MCNCKAVETVLYNTTLYYSIVNIQVDDMSCHGVFLYGIQVWEPYSVTESNQFSIMLWKPFLMILRQETVIMILTVYMLIYHNCW